MNRTMVLLLGVCTLYACSNQAKDPSAARRAEHLNTAKLEARALVDSGRYEEAIGVLKPLSEEASGDHQVFVMLGQSYQNLNRYDDAVAQYETAIRLSYRDPDAHLKLANLLMATGRTGRALTEYELAAQFGATDPVTRYDFGLALHQMGRGSRALEEWRAAYRLDSTDPRYAEAVGIGLTDSRPLEALDFFREAEALGADHAGFHNNFGLALKAAGERREAADRFERAHQLEPKNESYHFNLAAAYTNMGAYREAIPEWDGLIARFGQRWSYVVYRGRALLGLARYEEAIESVGTIVTAREAGELGGEEDRLDRTQPSLGDALEILAMSHRGAGDAAEGLDYIRRAAELEPDNVSYLNNYGVMLAESGNIDRAKSLWKRVLEIDADNVAARRNLSATEP